jgi:2-hydroxychromene-2-carboxylate isomerase
MKSAEWYFDFISPFAYLQFESLARLPRDLEIAYKPLVFAGILNRLQHKGPAEIPGKRRFTYRHVQWLAQHNGIALKFPPAHPFNPLRALRLAVALGSRRDAIETIFRFIWRDGRTLESADELQALAARLGVEDIDALISEQRVKDELRANGERANALGVFGVPTFAIDGELFWGFDATGMVSDYVNDPQQFNTAEMRRIGDLPTGAQRS